MNQHDHRYYGYRRTQEQYAQTKTKKQAVSKRNQYLSGAVSQASCELSRIAPKSQGHPHEEDRLR
jgi:hypothetical protein